MAQRLVLVTGATGTVGTLAIRQLIDAGQRVRALVRDPTRAVKLGPEVDIVVGDLADRRSLAPAFAGVDKVFVIANGLDLHLLEANAFDVAKRAGVGHIVKLSGRGVDWPEFASTALAEWHGESEKRLRALGPAWTILRPGFFASNALVFAVMQNGGYFLPVGDGKDAPIDPFDIAAVAVKVLTEPGHEGKIYEMTGPELLGFQQMIDKLAAFTGAKLVFVDALAAATLDGLIKGGVPPKQAEALIKYFSLIKAGRMTVEPTTAEVLGRGARRFDDWIAANAAALRS